MISGQFAWEGAAYVTQEKDEIGVASHRYYLLKPASTKITSEYIWAYLMSRKRLMDMQLCSHGAAGRNKPLNIRELLNVYIPLPISDSILQEITASVQMLYAFQGVATKNAEKITELRNLIIFQAATGKIDVRGIEIPDYEYVADDADTESDEDADIEETDEQEE